ncbi:nucleoside-diphosphate sugar epimerase [Anaerolineae bacterium]|nr:UDP-glucuronic acid decarboxylase 1 [Anaerolineaceae bacterium]GBL37551.1 UDP-glucuronic acid decarboxylase 1 [Anaerolineaceae bacterium]GDX67749.1 nucleoside-diphosphate sugar epimerase [Anaerolineae bacterium]
MNILVTGGLGTVGAPLCTELRRRGHNVWVCDLTHAPAPNYMRCDIGDSRQLARVLDAAQPELVFHLAAEFGRWNGEDYYERVWATNAIGTKHLLRQQEARRFRLVFTSSSEVYGDYEGLMTEAVLAQHPIRQLNDYAISKWVNEQQIMNSADRHATETVRVRLFNTYGPGEYYNEYRSVACQFIYRALHDLPYTVYLNHHRTSSYIDDTVRTLANLADAGRFLAGNVYNIAGAEYHDIKQLSDLVLRLTGRDDSRVQYVEREAHNTLNKRGDLTDASRDLGHVARFDLAAGVPLTIAWQRKVYGVQ